MIPIKKTATKIKQKTGDPETDHEPKGKVGRPKKNAEERLALLDAPPKGKVGRPKKNAEETLVLMDVDTKSTQEKRERKESKNGNEATPKKKSKKEQKKEAEEDRKRLALMNIAKKREQDFAPEKTQSSASALEDKASAAAEPTSPKGAGVKKTIKKNEQVMPTKIGIQRLREELEHAKLQGKLNTQDTSSYMQLYDAWVAAKSNKKLRDEKLKALREIYKRVVYKK